MLLVAGFVAYALLDPPLGVILLLGAVVFEIAETAFWIRFLRRYRIRTGVEALIGRSCAVIEECRPRGRVKLDGEIWNAECEAGAEVGARVRIREVRGLTLIVDPGDGPD